MRVGLSWDGWVVAPSPDARRPPRRVHALADAAVEKRGAAEPAAQVTPPGIQPLETVAPLRLGVAEVLAAGPADDAAPVGRGPAAVRQEPRAHQDAAALTAKRLRRASHSFHRAATPPSAGMSAEPACNLRIAAPRGQWEISTRRPGRIPAVGRAAGRRHTRVTVRRMLRCSPSRAAPAWRRLFRTKGQRKMTRARLVGSAVKRVEDPRLITGAGTYIGDLLPPGCLHAEFVRSQYAHARLNSVDVEAAR